MVHCSQFYVYAGNGDFTVIATVVGISIYEKRKWRVFVQKVRT
jgi:hypothetical protein